MTAASALRRDGDDITDHDLVARVRAGDDRAFERLYRRYHRRIASYIHGMVHDHARAEDIAQDVFMSALRRMRETDRTIAFKPWIYEIAKNACIDQFRRARRAEEVSMDADEGLGSADYGRLVSSGPTPDVAVDHKQQIDHLRGAFGGLSETHHEILVMRELEGLSYREIGEKLGMTRPAVESTLFRARRRLTEEYDELVTGERCVRVQQIISSAGGSTLGTRDKRRVARHVSYCQPCLRHARTSGLDARDLVHRPVRQKIAALLPLPAFLKERWGAPDDHGAAQASLAQWSAQASTVDPGLVASWSKAAATAATIALAGVGAGAATNDSGPLRDGFGKVTLESLSGGGNPGGSSSSEDLQASGSGRSGTGAAGSAGNASSLRGASSTTPGGKPGRGSTAAGTPAGAGQAGGSGPSVGGAGGGGGETVATGGADGDGGPAISGVESTAGGGAGSAGSGTQGLLPDLSQSDGGGSGGDGGGNRPDKGGDESAGIGVQAPVIDTPTIVGGSGGDPNKGGGGSDKAPSPVEAIGDKTAETVGGLTGG